jgi:hypothetical protein
MVTVKLLASCKKSAQRAGILIAAFYYTALFASSGTELVTNGDFSTASTTNWTLQCTDAANVTGAITDGQYVITRAVAAAATDTSSYGIQLSQKSIKMEKGKTYTLSVAAKADEAFIMTAYVGMNKSPWGAYSGYNQASVTTTLDTFSFEFVMDSASDAAARIVFDVGLMRAKGAITLDNISLKVYDAVIPPENELIKNGNFSSPSLANWRINIRSGSNAKATMKVVNEELEINIMQMCTPIDSALGWDVQLAQVGLKLQQDKQYRVTWDARSAIPYQIGAYVAMNKDPWGMYSTYNTPYLAEVMDTTYVYEFTMFDSTDPGARIGFDIGDKIDSTPRKVYFDNISLQCLDCNPGVLRPVVAAKNRPRLSAVLMDRSLRITGVASPASVRIFSASGKLVLATGQKAPGNGTVSFTLTRALAKGVYLISVDQEALPPATMRIINP